MLRCNAFWRHSQTLELNKYQKSDQAQFIIYADHECLIEKMDEC